MCGIIGMIGPQSAAPLMVEALKRLEYRGYDSAGIATLVNGHIERRRAEGKLVNLEALLAQEPLSGSIGIGHTRWATHGKPSERNAHPHATDRVAVVHNGIIENFEELKAELLAEGRVFASDTDTEVIAHLMTSYLELQMSPEQAMKKLMGRLRGAFALAIIISGRHDVLLGARQGSPLVVGIGENAMYLGSDALALAPFTNKVIYIEDGDWVALHQRAYVIYNSGLQVTREIKRVDAGNFLVGKGNHRHFMLKEIYEQPGVVGDTLRSLVNPRTRSVDLPTLPFDWKDVPRITLSACGTAFYACVLAKYWFEKLVRISVEVDIASELRYREPPLQKGGVFIAVSQSGETADTLEALRYAKREQQHILSVVNVPTSNIARDSDVYIPTLAGPEIGVASTKAFTTQLTVLLSLAIHAGEARGTLSQERAQHYVSELTQIPAHIVEILAKSDRYQRLGGMLSDASTVLYLGRGLAFPVALEGALKLKELSYIHAEGYAAGEMKHGPIALIDDKVPVIIIAPSDELFDKTASNLEQVSARDGKVILISDKEGIERMGSKAREVVTLPRVDPVVAPIIYSVAMQLIAYYTALSLGHDIDQPRNLAKSVTVE